MDFKLQVVLVPVSDVHRSRDFYSEQVGFNTWAIPGYTAG